MFHLGNGVKGLAEEEPDQYLEEEFNSKAEEMLYKKLYSKIMNDLDKKMTKGDNIKTEEEVDRMKFKKLIAEYKNFKRSHVQHFRFNSAANQTAFGQFKTITFAMLQCFRGRDLFNSPAGADLL